MLYVVEAQTSKSVWLMVHWNIFHVGVTVSQDVTAPLPLRLCLMLRLAALVLDCLETLYEDIAAQSRIHCSIAKSCPKVKKSLFWSYFEVPGNSNLFAFNKFLIIILSTFGLILHISTQIVQLSWFFLICSPSYFFFWVPWCLFLCQGESLVVLFIVCVSVYQ